MAYLWRVCGISNPKVVLAVIVSPLQSFMVGIALMLSGSRRDSATVAGPRGAVSTFVIKYVCSLWLAVDLNLFGVDSIMGQNICIPTDPKSIVSRACAISATPALGLLVGVEFRRSAVTLVSGYWQLFALGSVVSTANMTGILSTTCDRIRLVHWQMLVDKCGALPYWRALFCWWTQANPT